MEFFPTSEPLADVSVLEILVFTIDIDLLPTNHNYPHQLVCFTFHFLNAR
jgi:hypothetical protein